MDSIFWEDVEEGSSLPSFTYELSLLRLVSFVRASGLYDYIHFDGDYARSVGMRDAFMSTPHMGGLYNRLLTDWSGPEADVRALSVSMKQQCCTGDMLTISGKVGRKYVNEAGDHLVDIVDMVIGHDLAPQAVTATATMALPSRTAGPVNPANAAAAGVARPAPNAEIPAFAREKLGKVKQSTIPPTRPLTEHEILLWCEAIEDWNPLYWDREYAAKTRHGGIIAPAAMGWFYGSGNAVSSGIGYGKPGIVVPQPILAGKTGQDLLRGLREGLIAENAPFPMPDFPEAAVIISREDIMRVVKPGDSLRNSYELIDCSPLKSTRVGEGHFMSFINFCHNQRDELVKAMTLTLYYYRVAS